LKLLDINYTGVINLGTGEMNEIKMITSIIKELSGKEIRSLDKPVSGPMELIVNTALTKKLINWSPKFTLKEGLTKTYEIMKNYSKKNNGFN
jgi:nucleoside-diphosphate-sugar epimerase